MTDPLLATKLFIPPPAESLVLRPRLLEKLADSLRPGCRLTLVSAPAGYGKTTLVSNWITSLKALEDRPAPLVTWLSLDDGDNDPIVFWSYIVSALQVQKKAIGKQSLTLLQSPQPPNRETILSLLVNDLVKIPGDLFLILEDFHFIRTPAIHQSLSFLIDHAPPQFHVFILSRTDPPLPLALLRGRMQLLEVRQTDLRFTNEEAAAYLNERMNLSLPGADVDALNSKTEGWAAGIQMAGISLQGRENPSKFIRTFSGSNRFILDYLTDEILERQPSDIQTFLLYTSILDKLSASLCDAVIAGLSNAQVLLEQLEKNNLFLVPLDQERQWYRYHHLFSEILRLKLTRSFPEMVTVLQKRAAKWFETNDMLEEAVFYTHAAKDDDGLMHLLERNVGPMRKKGRGIVLRGWANLLPEEVVFNRPWLCILSAWAHISRSELAESEPYLERAEQLVKEEKSNAAAREMLGTISALRTEIMITCGDISGTIKMAQRAIELLDPSNVGNLASVYYSLGRAYYASGDLNSADQVWSDFLHFQLKAGIYGIYAIITGYQGTILAIQGKFQEAIRLYRQAIDYMVANGIEHFYISGYPYGGLGLMLYRENDLEEAEKLIDEDLRQNRLWGNPNAISMGLSNRMCVRIARGNLDGALADMRECEQINRGYKPYFDVTGTFLASQVHYFLAKGDILTARQLMDENKVRSDEPLSFQREQDHISLSRVLIAQGKPAEADNLLFRLAESARGGGRFGRLIEILSLRAIALQALNRTSEAMQLLEAGLALAEPEGYVRIYLNEGKPMADLLEIAIQRGIHPEHAARLLAAFPDSVLQVQSVTDVEKMNLGLVEPLSRRELEVLQFIAGGLANKEISRRLYISVRTVKYHATSIYAKLEVNGRREAAVKARELGLLK
jgi:LuxR family maltose regulon positive regulatory protein